MYMSETMTSRSNLPYIYYNFYLDQNGRPSVGIDVDLPGNFLFFLN